MAKFHQGARINQPHQIEPQLTLLEASFAMCMIAQRNGMDEKEFLHYMEDAFKAFRLASTGKTESQK